ncbi:hypothetical protein AN640_01945 [Candidatus Epulonipiscium fishelsonii]|uniref:Uncharacterized protein n=1 Tax=Candidatus Epulonipiscium fishelsonii TaxID=77094 RepID=A0ACC8XAE3_9FIRM|nr:hypothetical protein AN640_01945 [Epulopiscium sp. SCG-D08WGA-EpuloA1]
MPYSQKIINQLDEVSPEVKTIGFADTVKIEQNLSKGYNMNYYSFGKMLLKENIKIKDQVFYVLGTGDIAQSVVWYLKDNGARSIIIVSENIENTKEELNKLICSEEVSIIEYKDINKGYTIINTAYFDNIPKKIFTDFETFLDLTYTQEETLFFKMATEQKKKVISGLYMLVVKVIKTQEIWQNKLYNIKYEEKIFNKLTEYLKKCKKTIFLIGFVSSGKTAVGKYLAKTLGMKFVDCDKKIEIDLNKPVFEVFEAEGATAFREKEYEVLKSVNLNEPTIVATGSGCITYSPSYEYLRDKQVVYLYNDFNTIFSRIEENEVISLVELKKELENLYNYRFEIYEELAKYVIYCRDKSIIEIANEIKEYL